MRCASPVTFWVATSSGGPAVVQVDGLSVGAEGATCVGSEYVVVTQTEFDHSTVSPFRLSPDEASAIASAVLLVWASAWAIRVVVRLLRDSDASVEE